MCLILFAYQVHPDFPLVLAANRDEFYNRPTRSPHYWEDHPDLFAGRDLQAGGTWMGLTRRGRFAAITNFRQGTPDASDRPSRGELCTQFLTAGVSLTEHLSLLEKVGADYSGFNLLLGDFSQPGQPQMAYFSNRSPEGGRRLNPGLYGLSNGLLDDPWPKVITGKQALAATIESPPEQIQSILLDERRAAAHLLPDTGIDKTLEQQLSSRFIAIENYGTRSSTVLRIHQSGKVDWLDQLFDANGPRGSSELFTFVTSQ